MTQRKIEYWVIPPQQDAEFVAHLSNQAISCSPSARDCRLNVNRCRNNTNAMTSPISSPLTLGK